MSFFRDMIETKATFSLKLTEFCEANGLSFIEGISEYIQRHKIEIEDIPSLLTNELKALIRKEAVDLNMFRTPGKKVKFDDEQ